MKGVNLMYMVVVVTDDYDDYAYLFDELDDAIRFASEKKAECSQHGDELYISQVLDIPIP